MPKLIDKSQFDSVRRDPRIEALLPELVKRLMRSSAGPEGYDEMRIPDGEGYRDKGLDGQVFLHDPVGPLPAGELRLEIGATSDLKAFKAKATKEYKRVRDLVGDDAADMTFVMIGRVPWDGMTTTENDESIAWTTQVADIVRKEGKTPFGRCVLVDQSKLIDWANDDVNTSLWFLKALGHDGLKSPGDVFLPADRIELYLSRFQLNVDPDILIVEQDLEGLASGLTPGVPTSIYANSSAEASVAACHYLDKVDLLDDWPSVVITRESGVETLRAVPVSHIVILEGEAVDFANRLPHHRVVIARPLLRSMTQPGQTVLKRPSVASFAQHLDATAATADATTIARAVGRTMTALERGYGTDAARALAPWQDPEKPDFDLLSKLVILGGWNRGKIYDRSSDSRRLRHADLELIHELCGLGPVGKDRTIERLVKLYGRGEGSDCGAADPLFATGPDLVTLNAPVDAFYRFANLFTNEHYDILADALQRVLAHRAENPLDRDAIFNEADHYGYSPTLVGGLILSFVLIGVFGHQPPLDLRPDEQASPRWCEELYYDAMPSIAEHPQFIDSISQHLPLLAEGLTHPFLRSLEMLLEGNVDTVRSIFQPRETSLGLHKYHFGNALLWAIERVSWVSEHLLASARILMGLHVAAGPIDKGIGNQPIASLSGLLSLGIPQTQAPLEMRLNAYTMLADEYGTAALDLFINLLETRGSFQMSQSRPIFAQVDRPTLTYGDVYAARDHVASLAVDLVSGSAADVGRLVDRIPAMVDPIFERYLTVLRSLSPNSPEAVELSETLREFVGRHSEFPDAEWSLNDARLAPLRELQKHLVDDPRLELKWLFEKDYVRLHDGDRLDSYDRVNTMRVDAVPAISQGGIGDIVSFADGVGSPSTVGLAVGQALADESDISSLIDGSQAILLPEKRDPFLRGLSRGRALVSPMPWLESLTDMPSDYSADILRCLGEGLPSTPELIEAVSNHPALPDPVRHGFWTWMNIHALHHFKPSEPTVEALFDYGRAHDLAAIVDSQTTNFSDEVVARIFDEFLSHMTSASQAGRRSDMTLYHFWKLVEVVEDRNIYPLDYIARHQFPFSRTLRFNGPERPAALHRLLATKPEDFIEVVKLAYRADSQDEIPEGVVTISEADVDPHVSEAAYHALDSLQLLPGWENGELDSDRMQDWISKVMALAADCHRVVAAELAVGNLLGKSPKDPDDAQWPHRAVRDAIENGLSSRVIQHIQTGEHNNRGVYSGPSRAHHQKMADKFEGYAAQMEDWPRTRDMLLAIARSEQRWTENALAEERNTAASHGIR